jgi:ATP phosphoribosyltransferase regulatory subunit
MDNYVLKREEEAMYKLRSLYRNYGYSQYKMSKFEEYDLYVRNKNFLVSDNIITFTDHTGRLLALKPDVTLSIVKNSRDVAGKVNRIYYNENVYRVAPGSHDFREIMQVGLECIGEIDTYLVSEVLTLAAQSLERVANWPSPDSPDYLLEISHLDIVARVLDGLNIGGEARAALLGCLAEKNAHDMARICAEQSVSKDQAEALLKLVTIYGCPEEVWPMLDALTECNESLRDPVAELKQTLQGLPALVRDKVRIDFSLINDMNYYNGIVFRGYIKGIPDGILSGGRYDGLMRKMDRRSDAIGFAVYLDLLEDCGGSDPDDACFDTVILYDDATDLSELALAVTTRTQKGERVTVLRMLPAQAQAMQVLDLRKKEGTIDE